MASTKRLGTQKSATRAALVDAAEQLILEEGYAALTTRRLAEKSGLKFQLIYYYFNTLEDLILEVTERHSQRNIARLQAALDSDEPLRAIWRQQVDVNSRSGIIAELTVLAKDYPRVRKAIADNAEAMRRMEVEAVSAYLERAGLDLGVSAMDIVMLMTSATRTLRWESNFGMSLGHENLEALVETWLQRIERAAAD
jgi:AcrR family transcriptional regulator